MIACPRTDRLLAAVAERGVVLWVEGDKVHFRTPVGALPPALLRALKANKDSILARLRKAGLTQRPPAPTRVAEPSPAPPSASTPTYLLLADRAGLDAAATALGGSRRVGLDLETTGLSPHADRARLLSLATQTPDGGTPVFLVDCFAADPTPLWEALSGKTLVLHNALFDLQFLARLGFAPAGPVYDTMLLSQLLHGTRQPKGFHTLGQVVLRELGMRLDKAEQKSDWSGPLTTAQMDYAAKDAAILMPLFNVLVNKIKEAGLERVAGIERRALPAVAWMASHGVGFDTDAWKALADAAAAEAQQLKGELDRAAPPRSAEGPGMSSWNWNSPSQIKEVFEQRGIHLENTNETSLSQVTDPLAGLILKYRHAGKKAKTYGVGWVKAAYHDGRLHPGWKQIGADSGRMACSKPNAQNLPRDPRYRQCFVAPPGRVLIKADYSQIELRIAAKVSGDAAMLDAYQRGEDLHTRTARIVLGVEEITKQHRQLAKALNFGLLYGMGARGFRLYAKKNYGLDLSEEQAAAYRTVFFETYPGLAEWHRRVGRSGKRVLETRTLAGRRRLEVGRFTDKLNTPVQGTGADGLKLALSLLWERRDQCPGAFPVLAVHDEIVVEADEDQADAVAAWLKAAMMDAMAPLIDPVPVVVEVEKPSRAWDGGD
jgi:DNA polymerase-1